MAGNQVDQNWTTFSVKCCNPFSEPNHRKSIKNLRNVVDWMCSLNLGIKMGMKICDKCRKKMNIIENKTEPDQPHEYDLPGTSTDILFTDQSASVDFLNKSLELLGESPLKKKKISVESYTSNKIEKIKISLEKNLIPTKKNVEHNDQGEINTVNTEILNQLKNKFYQTSKRSEKITILTLLPQSWSLKKIEEEFGVSNYMARKVKDLVKEKGILSTPNPKPGKMLNNVIAQLVVNFYSEDDVSRMMPGKKDFVTIRNKGAKIQVQKRLMLANLSEVYQLFKQKYSCHKIGFSKFCELRPKNCILAGKSGTHTVCVCALHQNIKLMIHGAHLQNLVLEGDEKPLTSYHGFLAKIMCNPPAPDCYMNECDECPGIESLKGSLFTSFETALIDEVTYKKWITVDRCSMETVIKNTEDFVEEFTETLLKLKTHTFIALQQKESYTECKEHLIDGQIVINCDFAENYLFILQDEVQSYHWTNSQATLHPFIVYYKWEGKIKHLQYVFISECLQHNTVAFYTFQKKLISLLKETLPFDIKKLHTFRMVALHSTKTGKTF